MTGAKGVDWWGVDLVDLRGPSKGGNWVEKKVETSAD